MIASNFELFSAMNTKQRNTILTFVGTAAGSALVAFSITWAATSKDEVTIETHPFIVEQSSAITQKFMTGRGEIVEIKPNSVILEPLAEDLNDDQNGEDFRIEVPVSSATNLYLQYADPEENQGELLTIQKSNLRMGDQAEFVVKVITRSETEQVTVGYTEDDLNRPVTLSIRAIRE